MVTARTKKALLAGLSLTVLGIPIAILEMPVGLLLFIAGFFLVGVALTAIFVDLGRPVPRPGESQPTKYGPTLLGFVLRAIDPETSRPRNEIRRSTRGNRPEAGGRKAVAADALEGAERDPRGRGL